MILMLWKRYSDLVMLAKSTVLAKSAFDMITQLQLFLKMTHAQHWTERLKFFLQKIGCTVLIPS